MNRKTVALHRVLQNITEPVLAIYGAASYTVFSTHGIKSFTIAFDGTEDE
jgi:hypothetical protein